MARFKQCPHCLQSFDPDLVDIENHKRNCKRHIEKTVDRKIKEFWARLEEIIPS